MFLRPALRASYQTKLLIDNQWVNSSSNKTFQSINPATEEVIADIQWASSSDVNKAVESSRRAFDKGPWSRSSASERSALLYKLSQLIEKNSEELAHLESIDAGKPINDARAIDVGFTIGTYRYFAELCDKVYGKTIPVSGPYSAYTRIEPVGVAAQIIPWNVPMIMQSWKLGPALAAGCTSVLKPSEKASLSSLRVGELIVEAGFPPGVVNILPGHGDTGEHLILHPGVDKVAFTGSTPVGLKIISSAGVNGLKRVTLELGGKSPNIIMDDADMDLAIGQSQLGVFWNQGQVCIAGTRVFVHEKIYDEFVRRTVLCAGSRKLGNPLDTTTEQGAQIDEKQFKKILNYIEIGKKEGAKLLLGGKRWGNKGYFVEPTVFADVEDHMTIAKEEIFGPVFCIMKFKDLDEVIRRANNTCYGLGAGVVTKSLETALKVANGVRAGTVFVNCYNMMSPGTPFGGFKNSGVGREMGIEGLRAYTEQKTVIIKRNENSLP